MILHNLQLACIPKILHFIWFGKDIPIWGKNAMLNFQLANPLFRILLWHYTDFYKKDGFLDICLPVFFDALNLVIEHPLQKDPNFYNYEDVNLKRMLILCYCTIKFILGKNENLLLLYAKEKYTINNIHKNLYAALSDCLRFLILQKIGGIYLDLDTFPIIPFDDELIYNKNFMVFKDIYFLGTVPHNMFWYIKTARIAHDSSVKMLDPYLRTNRELNEAFWSGKLKYNDELICKHAKNLTNKQLYIYHFVFKSWCRKG